MAEIISFCVICVLAALWFVLGIRSLCQKGFLLNNAYIFASKKEREQMDKRPYYIQSGVVFVLIGGLFVIFGLDVLLKTNWVWLVGILYGLAIGIYAVISTVVIGKRKKNQTNL